MIHHWLGWISLVICLLSAAKYIGRISRSKKLNTALRQLHKPLGTAAILTAALHGVICLVKSPQATLPLFSGLMLSALLLALAISFYTRGKTGARWFKLHRILAAILCAVIIIHILSAVL